MRESAIPAHLATTRTRPARREPGWSPPYPSYVARFAPAVTSVAIVCFGVQHRTASEPADVRAALAELAEASADPDGPGRLDRAAYVDEAGYRTVLGLGYWDDPGRYDRWFARFRPRWLGERRSGGDTGFFVEALRPSVSRFETLLSNDRREGVACLADGLSGEIAEHGYWGGARDRLPVAQTDPLEPGAPPTLVRDGGLRVVRGQHNLCLIRSGQDWTDTDGDERRRYLDEVEPVLRAGMDFLRDEGQAVGCYANRYARLLGEDGEPVDKTFGMSWWRSLGHLDRWARDHPTHQAIFGQAMRYLSALGAGARLRLHHEVVVAAAAEQRFEYLGCHPRTGLLRGVGSAR
ncbi:aldoxime dehydratase [Prauserella shujinwangii]|uniref:Aldoxime dehydratase n=1 Tax=Prauserella shujinwangii TaxID=1453103 RepID=A0A2T0LTQ4_9PSEU|nr:phenylacetaldoxime dehydratase family protein [Prauserella shujinwangii]PRX47074.1 aldoxime dehydratase [Prauserella shujinwangii]